LVAFALVAATVAAVLWMHSAAKTSPDAWPTSVAAGTTAALALITLWYAYLTHRLLDAQRSAARVTGWETALRELSIYLNRERIVFWAASSYFPVDRPGANPPDLKALIASRDAFRRLRDHLLEVLGLLPRKFTAMVLPVTMRLVDAETEITALVLAMIDAMESGRAAGATTWTWADVKQSHEASDDQDRSEPWADVARGRYFCLAEDQWDELSSEIDRHLTS